MVVVPGLVGRCSEGCSEGSLLQLEGFSWFGVLVRKFEGRLHDLTRYRQDIFVFYIDRRGPATT